MITAEKVFSPSLNTYRLISLITDIWHEDDAKVRIEGSYSQSTPPPIMVVDFGTVDVVLYLTHIHNPHRLIGTIRTDKIPFAPLYNRQCVHHG